MSIKPILFSGPMVRALLEGRKTQTRRVLKPQPNALKESPFVRSGIEDTHGREVRVKYEPGDLLWVREGFQTGFSENGPQISYRATPDYFEIDAWDGPDEGAGPSFNYDRCPGESFSHWLTDVLSNDGPWRPSIHMPRWASRLTLEVTDVRVQRLQGISEEDAEAEGAAPILTPPDGGSCPHVEGFRELWDGINASRGFGWDANPWVVAVSFRVIPKNIDQVGG